MSTPSFGTDSPFSTGQNQVQQQQPQAQPRRVDVPIGRPEHQELQVRPPAPRVQHTQPPQATTGVSTPRDFYQEMVAADAAARAPQAAQFLGFDPITKEPMYSGSENAQPVRGQAMPTPEQMEAARWASHNQIGAPANGILHSDREIQSGDVQAERFGQKTPAPFPQDREDNTRRFDQSRAPEHVREALATAPAVQRAPVAEILPPPPQVAPRPNPMQSAPKVASVADFLAAAVPVAQIVAKVLANVRTGEAELSSHLLVDMNYDAPFDDMVKALVKIKPASPEIKVTISKLVALPASSFQEEAHQPQFQGANRRYIATLVSTPRPTQQPEVQTNG